jgi:hypothetical protein
MHRAAAMVLLLGLGGCASAAYEPYAVEISDQSQYAADLKTCQGYAAAYHPKFDAQGLAESAGEGAGGNAGNAALSLWAPVFGAVGAAAGTMLADAGVTRGSRSKIVALCMKAKTGADHSALSIDPLQ